MAAEGSGASCQEKIVYRVTGNDHFYIDQKYGEIFLISNTGDVSINAICSPRCSLTVSAQIESIEADSIAVEVNIS